MADVVRCVACGARFKVADVGKVIRAKVQCRKCGGALVEETPKATAVAQRHAADDDEEYNLKPSAVPAAAATAATTAAAPAIVVPAGLAMPPRIITEHDPADDEDAPFFERNKKLLIGITSAVVPILLAVIIAVTFTGRGGKGRNKRSLASNSSSGVSSSTAATPPAGPPPPAIVTPPAGMWPLPAGPGPAAKGKFVGGPVQLVRTDLPPRGMLFTGRDFGQAVIVSSPTDRSGGWLDRYDLTNGKRIGAVEMPEGSLGRVSDLTPDGNWLLTAEGHHLDVWSIQREKAVRTADVEIVGGSGEQPVWSGLAAPDIVLVLFETLTGDKLLAYTPRPASAPAVNVGTAQGETERKRDLRWSVDSLQTFTPRFTPDRQLIAYWADGAVRFANPATGKLVSSLPSQATRVGSGIAFDEACKRAAVVWRDLHLSFISVYDLATGKTIADFPLGSASSVAPRRWLGANDVLLDDGSVFDIKHGASIWQYEYANRLIQAVPHPDERFWFLAAGGKGEPSLLAAKLLPGPQELAGSSGASGAFVATKGMPVTVELDMSGPSEAADAYRRRVLGKLEARLRAFGMVPTPNAPAKLKLSASFQDTGEFARVTNVYGGSTGNGDDKVALKTLTGSVVLNDGAGSPPVKLKTVAVATPAHDKMPLKPGKSPADILQDMQWESLEGEVDDFILPQYIGRAPAAAAAAVRQSKLEP